MIKKLAWDAFKKTGNINTYLEFKEIESAEKNLDYNQNSNIYLNSNIYNNLEKQNGDNKN